MILIFDLQSSKRQEKKRIEEHGNISVARTFALPALLQQAMLATVIG